MTDENKIAVGARVTFITARQTARSLNFSVRAGTVLTLNGEKAIIKTRSGSLHEVHVDDVRAQGERNALTDAVLGALDAGGNA